jgi:hypothetical protein
MAKKKRGVGANGPINFYKNKIVELEDEIKVLTKEITELKGMVSIPPGGIIACMRKRKHYKPQQMTKQ